MVASNHFICLSSLQFSEFSTKQNNCLITCQIIIENSNSRSIQRVNFSLTNSKSPTISLSYFSPQTGRFKLGSLRKYVSWTLPVQRIWTSSLTEVLEVLKREKTCSLGPKNQEKDWLRPCRLETLSEPLMDFQICSEPHIQPRWLKLLLQKGFFSLCNTNFYFPPSWYMTLFFYF